MQCWPSAACVRLQLIRLSCTVSRVGSAHTRTQVAACNVRGYVALAGLSMWCGCARMWLASAKKAWFNQEVVVAGSRSMRRAAKWLHLCHRYVGVCVPAGVRICMARVVLVVGAGSQHEGSQVQVLVLVVAVVFSGVRMLCMCYVASYPQNSTRKPHKPSMQQLVSCIWTHLCCKGDNIC